MFHRPRSGRGFTLIVLIRVHPRQSAVMLFPMSAIPAINLRFRFLLHRHLDLADHIAMQADGHFKFA